MSIHNLFSKMHLETDPTLSEVKAGYFSYQLQGMQSWFCSEKFKSTTWILDQTENKAPLAEICTAEVLTGRIIVFFFKQEILFFPMPDDR